MNNDTNNKVTWKRNVNASTQKNDTVTTSAPTTPASNQTDELVELSKRAVDHPAKSNQVMSEDAVSDLKSEIEAALSGVGVPTSDPAQNIITTRNDSVVDLEASDQEIATGKADISTPVNDLPITPKAYPIALPLDGDLPITPKAHASDISDAVKAPSGTSTEKPNAAVLEGVAKDNHEALVASLKSDIQSDLKTPDTEENPVQKETRPADTGIKQTYYSDLSGAMSANEPATMSELIRKSRFEEKESKILSPRSKKNIAFIAGAVVLLIASIGILSLIFGGEEKVEFITQERVDSLVRSEQDTGINVTGLESSRIKQAIRDVIEIDIPEDTINQIYYVQEDGLNNLRRLGVKDIFDKTDNQTPPLLYDNIENNFTHGVYSTDKNYPFVILKSLSYDRALDGLLEWEPTMIDDLATYLDLPPEATDRSLIKPGFEDDLIRNKNVRVARFLPRDVDRRGILDFLGGDSEEDTNSEIVEPVDGEGLTFIGNINKVLARLIHQPVFAQTQNTPQTGGTSFGNIGNTEANDNTVRTCYNNLFPGQTFGPEFEGQEGYYCINTIGNNDSIDSGDGTIGTTNRTCYNNLFPGETFGPEFEGQEGYYCVIDGVLEGGNTLDVTVTRTAPVCFDPVTGDRIPDTFNNDGSIAHNIDLTAFCFEAYQCYEYRCYVGDTPVATITDPTAPRPPGYECRADTASGIRYHPDDARYVEGVYSGQLACTQFSGLTQLNSIDNATLCFDDETGAVTQEIGAGVSCISPLERQEVICLDHNNNVVLENDPVEKLCFQPLDGVTTNPIVSNQSVWAQQSIDTSTCGEITNNGELQIRLIQASFGLRILSGIGWYLGLPTGDIQNMNAIADFLAAVAYGDQTNFPALNEALEVIRQLDLILGDIDPYLELPQSGPNGGLNAYGQLLNIINIVKCVFNVGNNLQWITSDAINTDIPIYAGQSVESVEPIQQTFVQIGLMDPLSVTGTLDIVTQDAVSQFQDANGLNVTGILDLDTLALIANILDNQGTIINTNSSTAGESAIIANYFLETNGSPTSNNALQLGSYNTTVQDLQIVLYAEGYDISAINGLFTPETCEAVQDFQQDEGLEIADPVSCSISLETLQALDEISRLKGYVGSGFSLNPQGFLQGEGALEGLFGPGVTNFANAAEADILNEGDIVLLYTFLDEETILITRDEIVIDEVVQRRALSDIFE